jgi:hypothetical protein
MKSAPAILCALLLAATQTRNAHAQQAAGHSVVIRGEEDAASFSLRTQDRTPVVERCPEPCKLTLPHGKYRLEIFDPEGKEIGTRALMVERSVLWTASPQNKTARDLGLIVGIGGIIVATIGAGLFFGNASMHGDSSDAEDTRAGTGVLMALGGAIVSPIGWVIFSINRRPHVAVEPLAGSL